MTVFRSALLGCLLLGGCAAPLVQMAGSQLMQPQPTCPAGATCQNSNVASQFFQNASDSLHKLANLASADPAPSQTYPPASTATSLPAATAAPTR